MWLLNMLYPFWNRRQHRSIRPLQRACRPRRAVVSLCLEPLEERWLLNATITPAPAPTPAPPSQFQAVLSLFLDGAYIETNSLYQQYVSNPGDFDLPSAMANDTAAAAAAGINLNAVLSLNYFLGNTQTDLDAAEHSLYNYRSQWLTNDVMFNWQYAGVVAPYAVTAGAQAALQAVQQ